MNAAEETIAVFLLVILPCILFATLTPLAVLQGESKRNNRRREKTEYETTYKCIECSHEQQIKTENIIDNLMLYCLNCSKHPRDVKLHKKERYTPLTHKVTQSILDQETLLDMELLEDELLAENEW